jgi:hypothetical protein
MSTVDPKQVKQSFNGVEITGYASGTFLSITSEDGFEKDRGSDGGIDYINKNANDLDVVCTLKQTSESNLALSALHELDKVSNAGIGAYLFDDLQGDSRVFAPIARIMKRPDLSYSDTMESREWLIGTGTAIYICGGNI